jgi:hypothetical protein
LCFERLHVGSYTRMSKAAHDGTAGFLARNPEPPDLDGRDVAIGQEAGKQTVTEGMKLDLDRA